jgi:hypothetical protein
MADTIWSGPLSAPDVHSAFQGYSAAPNGNLDSLFFGAPYGGNVPANVYGTLSVSMYNPKISLNIAQLSVVERDLEWGITVLSLQDNVLSLTKEMESLRSEIRELCRMRTFVVPLTTLAPAPFQITQQIPVTIQGDGEEFTATFTEANVSASGETEADAIANFKDSLVSTYTFLESLPADELGPLPARQWEVLRSALTTR